MLGRLLAYSCLCPFFILSAFTTLIFFRRDLHTVSHSVSHRVVWEVGAAGLSVQVFYFVGILLNEAINLALKNTIRDPRPDRRECATNPSSGPLSQAPSLLAIWILVVACTVEWPVLRVHVCVICDLFMLAEGDRSTFDHYGMPSSHAQFMWFFSAYLSLFVAFR